MDEYLRLRNFYCSKHSRITFFIPIKEIKQKDWDLSISKYREIEYEEVKYEKPEVLKKKILELEKDIIKGLEELKI